MRIAYREQDHMQQPRLSRRWRLPRLSKPLLPPSAIADVARNAPARGDDIPAPMP